LNNQSNTILVTGGAGYIGSHTIVELINNGFDVISIDNYSNSTEKTYERINKITQRKIIFYELDVCNYEKLKSALQNHKNITGIIHFAALKSVPESVEKPELYKQNNMTSLANITRLMNELAIPNLIFSSSCSVYGNVQQLPVNELTPMAATESPYAETKLQGELFLENFIKKHNQQKSHLLALF
jgi:UDP-glucose 4-epimerase